MEYFVNRPQWSFQTGMQALFINNQTLCLGCTANSECCPCMQKEAHCLQCCGLSTSTRYTNFFQKICWADPWIWTRSWEHNDAAISYMVHVICIRVDSCTRAGISLYNEAFGCLLKFSDVSSVATGRFVLLNSGWIHNYAFCQLKKKIPGKNDLCLTGQNSSGIRDGKSSYVRFGTNFCSDY